MCSQRAQVLCAQVCRTSKMCGNHRCNQICCPGFGNGRHEAHYCLEVCGKPLTCGSHMCEDFCHLGRCPPCRVVSNLPLYCACGENCIDPPVVCGTEPPFCDRLCEAELPCGHLCVGRCHIGDHPICCELVDRSCLGGHCVMTNKPCHVGAMSCGQKCDRMMQCGHLCTAQCHSGECPPCTQPCGANRAYCEHQCDAPCHHGEACEDVPCRRKIKSACACGLRIEEKLCGADSDAPWPVHPAPRCNASCERLAAAPGTKAISTSGTGSDDPVKYAADLQKLAMQHRRYVLTLEDFFRSALGGSTDRAGTLAADYASPASLPPCDSTRRLLAVEYARLHWRLRTTSKPDSADSWWLLRVEPVSATKGPPSRVPRPLLSELCSSGSGTDVARYLSAAMGMQSRLRFTGLRGPGDEVYDLVGLEGLLGVRPGEKAGEVLAFMDCSATAVAATKRLTGAATAAAAAAPLPLRGNSGNAWGAGTSAGSAWGAADRAATAGTGAGGIRVLLQQPLVGNAGGPRSLQAAGAAAQVAGAAGVGGESREALVEEKKKQNQVEQEVLPDSWDSDSNDD